jgi:hypothetical protein
MHVLPEWMAPAVPGLVTDPHPLVGLRLVAGFHEACTLYPLDTLLHTSYGMSWHNLDTALHLSARSVLNMQITELHSTTEPKMNYEKSKGKH